MNTVTACQKTACPCLAVRSRWARHIRAGMLHGLLHFIMIFLEGHNSDARAMINASRETEGNPLQNPVSEEKGGGGGGGGGGARERAAGREEGGVGGREEINPLYEVYMEPQAQHRFSSLVLLHVVLSLSPCIFEVGSRVETSHMPIQLSIDSKQLPARTKCQRN